MVRRMSISGPMGHECAEYLTAVPALDPRDKRDMICETLSVFHERKTFGMFCVSDNLIQ